MSAFNNNNPNLNNTSAGQTGRVANMNSTTVQPPNQLNENHGIAATGLNDPHTHANTQGLNYSGPPIADTRRVDQQENYNQASGQGLNRTGGTGVSPVKNAEQIRRTAAEEALGSNHHGNRTHHTATTTGPASTGTAAAAAENAAVSATGSTTVGNFGSHNQGVGLDEKALHGSHGVPGSHTNPISTGVNTSTHQGGVAGNHHPFSAGAGVSANQRHKDPTSVGATAGTHPSGEPLGTGLPHKDQKHVGDQRFNDKHSNLDHPKSDTLNNKHKHEDTTKVGAGDKIKGNLEKMAGKITGNEAKVVQGENIAQGRTV